LKLISEDILFVALASLERSVLFMKFFNAGLLLLLLLLLIDVFLRVFLQKEAFEQQFPSLISLEVSSFNTLLELLMNVTKYENENIPNLNQESSRLEPNFLQNLRALRLLLYHCFSILADTAVLHVFFNFYLFKK
jgi:hypothetical protein